MMQQFLENKENKHSHASEIKIAQYHGRVSLKMLSEWNILVLTNAQNETKRKVTTIFTMETDLKYTKNNKLKR